MVFDKLMVKLNEIRIKEDDTIINEISQRTKAGIVLSILGLGHIFKQQGFWELKDLPFITNCLETELRFNDMRMTHKVRGQHPSGQGIAEQIESEDSMSWGSLLVAEDDSFFMPSNLDLGGSFGDAGPSHQGELFDWEELGKDFGAPGH